MKVIKYISNVLIERQDKTLILRNINNVQLPTIVCINFDYTRPIGQVEIRKTEDGYFGDIAFGELQDRLFIGKLYPIIAYKHNSDGTKGIFALGLCSRENADPEIKPLSHYLQ